MKKIITIQFVSINRVIKTFLFLFLFSTNGSAQTFYTETFDGTVCALGSGCDPSLVSWTTTNIGAQGSAANKFYVSCTENGNAAGVCGSGCGTDQSLHVGNVSTSSAAAFWCPAGDCGASYDASSAAEVANKRMESPVINCSGQSNITIAFNYMEGGEGVLDDASLVYFDGAVWIPINALAKTAGTCAPQGLWTAFSMLLPASADGNPNVKIGFVWKNDGNGNGTDPSFAVDDITLTSAATTNTITTGTITGSPFCACSSVNVPFTSTGTFTAGNIYTAQLSNAAGSFAVPVAIGTLASTANTGTISATIPCGTPTGSGYRIRVVSSAPAITGTDNGVNITINAPPVATFSYTGTPYCSTGTDPSPTFSGGGVAGTFTSAAGVVFISSGTGQVDLSASTPGTYTVTNTIAASGGCASVSATSTITINAPPVATFSYTGTPYCSTGADPSPTFSGGGVAGTFTSSAGVVFISSGTGQVDLSASTPGTYTVTNTIAASGGCAVVTATSSIVINPVQSSAFSYSSSTFCQTGTDPAPTITGVSGGVFSSTPAGLVFISTATGVIDLSASSLNTYTITYTTAGPCPSSSTASVTISTAPAATFSYIGTPYCADAADPSPTFSGGGSAGTFTSSAGLIFISASTGQIDLSASTAGTYTVTNTIPASGGCASASATSSITITPVQDSSFNYSGSTFCQSGTNPTPTVVTAGGTFTSSPAGLVFVSAGTGEINLSSSTLGTYSITYTTPGPCASSSSASVTITTAPVTTFSYTASPYCSDDPDPSPVYSGGGTAGTFTSSGGLIFVSAATGQVDLSASTAGTYTVTNTIAASGGCPVSSSTSAITINAVQDSSFSYSGSTFCQSGTNPTPTVSTSGGAFTSSPAGLVFVSAATGEIDLASSTLGTYSVTYTTPGPCAGSSSASVTITTSSVSTFSYTGTPYCSDAADPSPTFSGGGSAGTYTSSGGLIFVSAATGQVDLSASTAGTYSVTNTIAASGGCPASSSTSSITIDPVQDSTFSYSSATYCQSGTNPTPTTATAGGTFTSSPAGLVFVSAGTGEIDLTASTLGTYSVTYTTPGPCSSSSNVSVEIITPPTGAFSYTATPYCQNDSDPSPTFSGGGVAGTFSSAAGLVFVSASTGQVNLSSSTAGTYTVTNTIASSGGCPAVEETSTITINPSQDSTFSYSSATYCQSGPNPSPTVTGTPGGIFTSSPAGLTFVSSGTGEIDLASSSLGTYSVTYTTPGPCASSSSVSVSIIIPPTGAFSYTGTPYCQNDPNPSPTYSGGGIAGAFTSSSGLVFASASTGEVNLSSSTSGTYTVTNTIVASGGCPAVEETSTITINALPTVTVNSAAICNGETANLTASGADTYSWSAGATATGTATATASPTTTTSYTVTGTTAGCAGTAVSVVTVNECNVPVADFTVDKPVMCEADCANFTDLSTNDPTSWSWSFPGASPSSSTLQNPTNICYSADGSYDVTLIVSNANGSDTLTKPGFITVGSPVTVEITGNLLITPCEETVLTAVPSDGTYVWGPSATLSSTSGSSVTAAPQQTQQYYVTYTNPDGCTDQDTVTVVVEDINTYFLPTGFTPNGDGINDEIHLHGRGIDNFSLKIYDRIGEKVFETSDLEKGWNGKLFGIPMNNGVFVYVLDITFCNGENVKKHGDITLVK